MNNKSNSIGCKSNPTGRKNGGGQNHPYHKIISISLCVLLILTMIPVFGDGAPETGTAAQPTISRNPSASTFSENADARFYVNASSGDGGYLTYQWHVSQAYAAPVAGVNLANPAVDNGIKATGATVIGGDKYVLTTKTPDVAATTYYYYWVTITNNRDFNGDGDTTDSGEQASIDSAFAETKVVNRELEKRIENGDFSTVRIPIPQPDGTSPPTLWWSNRGETAKMSDYYTIVSERQLAPWKTTDYQSGRTATSNKHFEDNRLSLQFFSLNNTPFANDPDYPNAVGAKEGGASTLTNTHLYVTEGHGVDGTDVAPYGAIELCNAYASSVYQEVATVPGKIYEWHVDHMSL